MSVEDRDWYREDFKRKEKEYGGDFSIHSKPKREKAKTYNRESYTNKPAKIVSKRRMTVENILVALLCTAFVWVSITSFIGVSAMGLTYYIPAIIVEISVFNYTYKTSKEYGNESVISLIALLICGFSIILSGTMIISILMQI